MAFGTSVMSALNGVSREWEQQPEVRDHVRAHGCLLKWDSAGSPKINTKNGGLNFWILKPLAQRLLDNNGEVSMHGIPAVESQYLE